MVVDTKDHRRQGLPDLKVSSMNRLPACRASDFLWRRARALMQRLIGTVNDPYRPERHYMRGPGPKCRAKRERTSSCGEGLG
jgi:hypothetical protein